MRVKTIALYPALLAACYAGKVQAQFADSTHYRVNYTSSGLLIKQVTAPLICLITARGYVSKRKTFH